MGLGKSLTLLAILDAILLDLPKTPIMLLCPVSVVFTWYDEVHKVEVDPVLQHVHVLPPLVTKDKQANASTMAQWQAEGGIPRVAGSHALARMSTLYEYPSNLVLAIDEIHMLKNKETDGHKAVAQIRAGTILALTGTPLQNNIGEFYNIVSCIRTLCLMCSRQVQGVCDGQDQSMQYGRQLRGGAASKSVCRRDHAQLDRACHASCRRVSPRVHASKKGGARCGFRSHNLTPSPAQRPSLQAYEKMLQESWEDRCITL